MVQNKCGLYTASSPTLVQHSKPRNQSGSKTFTFWLHNKDSPPLCETQIKKEGIVKVVRVTENTAEEEKLDRKAIVKINLKTRKGASNKLYR